MELRSAQASPPALEVTTETGILLMGARLYNPVTSLFTSLDPIYGGNDIPYTYPNDPINKQDLTGQKWSWRKAFKSFRRAAHNVASSRVFRFVQGVCGFTWGVAAVTCSGAIGAVQVAPGDYRGAAKTVALGAASFAGGRLAYAAVKRASGMATMSTGVARRGKGVAQAAKRLIKGTTRFRRKSANFGLSVYVSSKFGAYDLYDTYGRRRRR